VVTAEFGHLGTDEAMVVGQLARALLHSVNCFYLVVPRLGVIGEGNIPPEVPDAAFRAWDNFTFVAMFGTTAEVNEDFKTWRDVLVRKEFSGHSMSSLYSIGISHIN
jgi:hypothetical protein